MKQLSDCKSVALYVILIIFLVLLIASCGSGESQSSSQTNAPEPSLPVAPAKESDWKLLDESHGINGNAWQLEQCDACHLISDIHQQQSNIKNIVIDKGYQTCVGCHGDNGTQVARQCLVCHNSTDLPQNPIATGDLSHNFNPDNIVDESINNLTDQNCLDCHIASDMNGQFDINTDLTRFIDGQKQQSDYQSSSEFCLRCHNSNNQQVGFEMHGKDYQDPLIAMATNYAAIDFHGDVDGIGERVYSGLREGYNYKEKLACTDCHAMHGTHNEKLIIGSTSVGASKLNKDFFAPTIDIHITTQNGDSSQLCVVCHQMQTTLDDGDIDTGNGLSGVHLTGQECRSCHQHGMATQTGL